MNLYGRWEPSYVDGNAAKAHLQRLVDAGFSLQLLSVLTGSHRLVMQRLHAHPGGEKLVVDRRTMAALLTVDPESIHTIYEIAPDDTHVSGVGSRRRLRALVAAGWTQRELARMCQWTPENLGQFINHPDRGLAAASARRIAAVFTELQLHPGGTSTKSRRLAQRRGWAPPLAWEEDSIDDPASEPCVDPEGDDQTEVDEIVIERCLTAWRSNTTPPAVSRAEQVAVASALLAAGATRSYACKVVGCSLPTLTKRLAA